VLAAASERSGWSRDLERSNGRSNFAGRTTRAGGAHDDGCPDDGSSSAAAAAAGGGAGASGSSRWRLASVHAWRSAVWTQRL